MFQSHFGEKKKKQSQEAEGGTWVGEERGREKEEQNRREGKSKLLWDANLELSKWLRSITQVTAHDDKDVGPGKYYSIAVNSAHLYSHHGNPSSIFSVTRVDYRSTHSSSENVPKGLYILQRYTLLIHAHCCSIHSSQKLETAYMDGSWECSTLTQWNIIQLLKKTKI